MSLFGFSRELLFKVSNQHQSHASPQSAGKGEHFYRGEGKLGGMSNSVHFFSLAESLPGKERGLSSSCWGCSSCNLMYQSYQRLSTGDHMGLLESSVAMVATLCLEGLVLFRASLTLSASQGRCSLQVFSPLFRGHYWEVLWLVHAHITRKWQSLDSNIGTFPNEAHQVQFLFLLKFFKLEKAHNIKFTILMIFKHTVQYC